LPGRFCRLLRDAADEYRFVADIDDGRLQIVGRDSCFGRLQ
jgi:hypothetical protein